MDKSLSIKKNEEFHFKVEEGSNYLVVFTYGWQEVITYEHFIKLAKEINRKEVVFVTVNAVIAQKKDIRIIRPTKEKTLEEREKAKEQKVKEKEKEKERIRLIEEKRKYCTQILNEKYGIGGWVKYYMPKKETGRSVVGKDELIRIKEEFEKRKK